MRIYEEVDRNLHDLEKVNEKLKNEGKTDKDRIKRYYYDVKFMLIHNCVTVSYLHEITFDQFLQSAGGGRDGGTAL